MKNLLLIFLLCGTMLSCRSGKFFADSAHPKSSTDRVEAMAYRLFSEVKDTISSSDKNPYIISINNTGRALAHAAYQYLRSNGMNAMADSLHWEFKLVDSQRDQLICLPGGKILLYKGIFSVVRNANELAAVLSHQMAHHILRHSYARLYSNLNGKIDKQSNRSIYRALKKSDGIERPPMMPYTLAQEAEVDRLALVLMGMADFDPTSGILFWDNAHKTDGKSGEYLKTHPADDARIKRLNDMFQDVIQYFRYD